MLASIVIPVKNDPRILQCVQGLVRQTLSEHTYEILVIDNGSHHVDIATLLRNYPVKIYQQIQGGMVGAINHGIDVAKGEILVRIDADCEPEKDWLENLLKPFNQRDIVAVGGVIKKMPGENLVQQVALNIVTADQKFPQRILDYDMPYVVGANSAFRIDVIRQLGGYDEIFKSGNDVDICWRIGQAGHRIVMADEAIVHHPARNSIGAIFRQYYNYGLGHVLLFKKHKSKMGKTWQFNGYHYRMFLRIAILELPKKIFIKKHEYKKEIWKKLVDLAAYGGLVLGRLIGAIKFGEPFL